MGEPTAPIDLGDLAHFRRGAPHAIFDRLRRDHPVHWNPEVRGAGFWSLTRHADVLAVSRASDDFPVALHGNMIFDQFGDDDPRAHMMIELDDPEHARYRALVNRGFSSRQVQRLFPYAHKRVGEILDAVLERGRCDFVADVAGLLPTAVIAELMGVPSSDREALYEIANRVMAFSDPEYGGGEGGANTAAMAEMMRFAADLGRERRRRPAEDLTSQLLQAEVDGECLSQEEFELFFLMLITAGIETTRSAIASGMLAFEAWPDEWRRLRAGEVCLDTAVEEVLRFTSPIHHFRRTAARDLEIAGQPIASGQKVVIWYSSANRDERVFPDPHRFDVGRKPNEHLAFGFGRHFCLGASLARLELGAMLAGLAERGVVLELAGDPEWLASNFAQSPKRMPVALPRQA